MKKIILLIAIITLQGCASNHYLVNNAAAANAYQYEAIAQLPKKDMIGQEAYVGGQIVAINQNKRQVEFMQRRINQSGYPEEGTNNPNARIFVTFSPEAAVNLNSMIVGDRIAVLGDIIDIKTNKVAGNEMTVLHIRGTDYRTWTSRNTYNYWDDDYYHGFNSIGYDRYPRRHYRGSGVYIGGGNNNFGVGIGSGGSIGVGGGVYKRI